MLDRRLLDHTEGQARRATGRTSGIGMRSGLLARPDEQALRVFWDQRKREAGKLGTQSPYRPRDRRRLGRARFYWHPTRDLERSWSGGLFVWISLIVTVLAVAAAFALTEAYSPGALSTAHARGNFLLSPAIAKETNSASCTTCHSFKTSMRENCASCHTTPAFDPRISDEHRTAGLSCNNCHGEHRGRSFQPALMAKALCVSCHRDGVVFQGKQLRTPHGGTLGYPVLNGEWAWAGVAHAEWRRKNLPRSRLDYNSMEQFHLVHVAGLRQGRANCSDCHTAGLEGEAVRRGVRESCATCHSVNYQAGSSKEAGTGCIVCHSQHGEEKELKASKRRMEANK